MSGPELITLGCRLNIAESEAIRAMLAGEDDLIVVNSCAVTAEAVATARKAVRRAKRERPEARIVVTGCAAEIEPETFLGMVEVTDVVPNLRKLEADLYSSPLRRQGPMSLPASGISRGERGGPLPTGSHQSTTLVGALQGRREEHARAFLPVQNGCDHRCTFCIIPFGRGPSRSLPAGGVIDEIRTAMDAGAKEVVLTGVDLTAYGADLPGAPTLGTLVERILRHVPQLQRLRLSSLDPCEVDDRLADLIAHEPRLMPHLHLSLQAGDDLILKRMKRRHSRGQAIDLVARLKALRPDLAIGADLIAGFPTEDEAAFANTLRLIDECQIVFAHIFPYSPRNGTPAARMPQVARSRIKDRAARLRAAGAAMKATWLKEQVGKVLSVLVELDGVSGHADNFARVTLPSPLVGEGQGGGGGRGGSMPLSAISGATSGPSPQPLSHEGRGALPNTILPVRITAVDGETLLGVAA